MSDTKRLLRQLVREIAARDVKVDGFSFNDSLEKRVWSSDDAMHDDVREALLRVAESFVDGLDVEFQPEDIRLTGSLANYNWSKYSDVDLHIIVNFSEVDEDQDLVEGYFNSAAALWNLRHDIKVKGYDVEIYVENAGEEHVSTGLYSVLNGEWIRIPPDEQGEKISFDAVKKKAAGIMRQIAELEKMDSSPEETIRLAEKVKEKIRRMRRSGLRTRKGQYSTGNIAFKVLRRNGSLEKLSNIKNDAYDTSMSITESRIVQIIREELLQEIPGEIIDPSQGSAPVPVTKDSQIGRASTDTAARQASYMTSSLGRTALEVALGMTPAGPAIDATYLAWALYNRDATGAVWAGIGFLPFVGDAFKGFRKTLSGGKQLSSYQKRAVEEAIDGVRATEKAGDAAKLEKKAAASTSSKRAAHRTQVNASSRGALRAGATMSREAASKAADTSRSVLKSSKLGQTKVLDDDMYVFIAANPGKVAGGYVSRSKGIQAPVEEVLEKSRLKWAPNAVPRTNTVYVSPYADAGIWRSWGSDVYMVKIPKGSKITIVDGSNVSYANTKLRDNRPEEAATWAEYYWRGDDAYEAGTEIMTQANVSVVGKVQDLLDPSQIKKLSSSMGSTGVIPAGM